MAPVALQKVASSFSSGGNGLEQSSPNSTRSFSGSIRGFLQNLRVHAGLSTDATSPRGSRSGHSESSRPGTPHVSGAAQPYVPILDSLHTELDESDTEHTTKWLRSSAHGMLGIPTDVAPSVSSPRPGIFRSYSCKRSKGAAIPAFVTSSGNNKPPGLLHNSGDLPTCSKSTSASAFLSGGARPSTVSRVASRTRDLLAAAAGAFTSDNTSPPQTTTIPAALLPTPVYSTSPPQPTAAPSALQLSLPAAPCSANAAIAPDSTAPVHTNNSLAYAQPDQSPPQSFGSAQPDAAQLALHSMEVLMSLSCPPPVTSTLSVPSSMAGTTTTSFDVQGIMYSMCDEAATADDGLATGIENGKASRTAQSAQAGEEDGSVAGNDVVHAMVVDIQTATVDRLSTLKNPPSVELSPDAVSQAVQRLQIRQQQERASSGRFQRVSGVVPGGGPLHSHSSPQVQTATAAVSLRPISFSNDSADSVPYNQDMDGSESSGAVASSSALSSSLAVQQPMTSSQHVAAAAISQTPFVGRRMGGLRAASGSSPFVHPYGLYEHPRVAPPSGPRARAVGGAARLVGGSGSSLQRANSGADGQWEEWLGEAPYVSRGRTLPSLSTFEAMRSSVSYTEGQASGADRLQALVNSGTSDDAAFYLQQLLLPDNHSTASMELQYSGTQTHVASALPYGGSCGAAYGLGGRGGTGSSARLHSEIESGVSGVDAGLWSGLGLGMDGPNVRTHSSSRAISGLVGSSTACGVSSPIGSQPLGRRPKSAIIGGATISFASQTGRGDSSPSCPHALKSATELFEELLQTFDNTESSTASSKNRACASSTAPEAPSSTAGRPAEVEDEVEALLLRGQLREELEAALWRLVRAKNADAVSFLLALDPAAKANRPLAPLLKELRSWMYTSMW